MRDRSTFTVTIGIKGTLTEALADAGAAAAQHFGDTPHRRGGYTTGHGALHAYYVEETLG